MCYADDGTTTTNNTEKNTKEKRKRKRHEHAYGLGSQGAERSLSLGQVLASSCPTLLCCDAHSHGKQLPSRWLVADDGDDERASVSLPSRWLDVTTMMMS
jgi:hypothetical protein